MNSLEELNTYGSTVIDFIDNRDPEVLFDRITPEAQAIEVHQHSNHYIPIGINVIDIINATVALAKYKIDISDNPDAVITWTGLPSYLTVATPAAGVYIVSGMLTVGDWDLIKSPKVTTPLDYVGEFTYQATVSYTNISSAIVETIWVVTCTVVTAPFLTAPGNMYLPLSIPGYGHLDIVSYPTIQDEYPTEWELRISGLKLKINPIYTNSTYTSHPNGGSLPMYYEESTVPLSSHFIINGVDMYGTVFTENRLYGTREQINTALAHLYYQKATSGTEYFNSDITLTWTAINITTEEIGTATQTLQTTKYLSATRSSDTYQLNSTVDITGGPQANTYDSNNTMAIVPSDIDSIDIMSATGSYDYTNNQSVTGTTVRSTALSGDGKYMAYSTVTPTAYASITGTVATGSHTISGSFSTGSFLAGDIVDGPFLPPNTKIVSFNSSSIIVSNTATGNYTNAGFHLLRSIASVKVYSRADISNSFTLLQTLTGSRAEGALYGSVLKFTTDGSRLLISTPGYSYWGGNAVGYVELYAISTGTYALEKTFVSSYSGTTDIRTATISADGLTVAIGDTPYIGGTITIHTRTGTTWTQRTYWTPYSTQLDYYTNGSLPFNINLSEDGYTLCFDNLTNTYTYVRNNLAGSTWTSTTTIVGNLCSMTTDAQTIYTVSVNSIDPSLSYSKVYARSGSTWSNTETISGSVVSINGQNNTRNSYTPGSTPTTSIYKIYTVYAGEWVEVVTITKAVHGTMSFTVAADGDCFIGSYSSAVLFYQGVNQSGVTWTDSTKTLSIAGSTDFINDAIDTIKLTPSTDYNSNIILTYTLKSSSGTTLDSRIQQITYTS